METKDDITKCPICKESYVDPRILPCIHTLCFRCVGLQRPPTPTTATVSDHQPVKWACPLCHRDFAVPNGCLDDLPRNYFMEKLVKINRMLSPSASSDHDVPCDECQCDPHGGGGGGAVVVDMVATSGTHAVGFCLDCDENLCEPCLSAHRRMRATKAHQVVAIGDRGIDCETPIGSVSVVSVSSPRLGGVASQRAAGSSFSPSSRGRSEDCASHRNEPIKMYCSTCELCICFLCYAEQHTGHKCSDINRVAELSACALAEDVQQADRILSEESADLVEIDRRRDVFLAQVEQSKKFIVLKAIKLKELIDVHSNELVEELVEFQDVGLSRYDQVRSEMTLCSTLTEGIRSYASEVLDKGNANDILRNSRELHDRVKELHQTHSLHHDSLYQFNTAVYAPYNVQQLLNNENIDNLIGKIDQREPHNVTMASSTDVSLSTSGVDKGPPIIQIKAKGSLIIRDCADDGTCITIENTGVRPHAIGNYRLVRNVDGTDCCEYGLPRDTLVSARSKFNLWTLGCKPSEAASSPRDLETTQKTWGIGDCIITRLEDSFGEECASHVQTSTSGAEETLSG